MEKIVKVDGKEYKMVANAYVPRFYRNTFGSDMILDMQELINAYGQADGVNFPPKCLTIFENVAWCFLKMGGEEVGNSADEWLMNLDGLFSVYEVLPQIMELWQANVATTSKPTQKTKANNKGI